MQTPCYKLSLLLDDETLTVLKPYMRETFTETWRALGDTSSGHDPTNDAVETLRTLARVSTPKYVFSWKDEGREIEKGLYQLAVERELPITFCTQPRTRKTDS